MRTDLVESLAGSNVRGVVTVGALEEMIAGLSWSAFTDALESGDPRTVRSVLRAAMRAAGDLRPVDVENEATRLIEEAGLNPCHAFALRLVQDALSKVETARKNSRAVPADAAPAADGT